MTYLRLLPALLALSVLGEELPPPAPAEAAPEPKPAPKVIVQEGIRIRPSEGLVEIDATIVMERGVVEVYASSPGGKLHESLLVIKPKPQFIHFGLIILGLKEGTGTDSQGGKRAPRGELVDLFIEWEEGGKSWRARAEDMIYNIHTKKDMEGGSWVFTGSRFVKDVDPNTGQERDIYLANATGTVITTFRDPSSILDNASEFGGDDTSYVVNEAIVPPAGTPVVLVAMPKGKGPADRREILLPRLSEADAARAPGLVADALGADAAKAAESLAALASMGRPALVLVRDRLEGVPAEDEAGRTACQKLLFDLRAAIFTKSVPAPPQPESAPKGEPAP